MGQPHQMPRHFQLQIGFQQMAALVPPVVGPQTIFLRVQQLRLNPVSRTVATVKVYTHQFKRVRG